ncbi:MAG: single-stranded DNA-binding protein [Magnetococcales bacterium]|nr:single-stranded DNA-binding protein [Magnetococcales bacterium]
MEHEALNPLTNSIQLEGTLTGIRKISYTPGGIPVATLELEHLSSHADIIPLRRLELKMVVVVFDSLADLTAQFSAGTRVRIHGRLNQKRWIRENKVRWGPVEVIATAVDRLYSEENPVAQA